MTDGEVDQQLQRLYKLYGDRYAINQTIADIERALKNDGVEFKMSYVGASWKRVQHNSGASHE